MGAECRRPKWLWLLVCVVGQLKTLAGVIRSRLFFMPGSGRLRHPGRSAASTTAHTARLVCEIAYYSCCAVARAFSSCRYVSLGHCSLKFKEKRWPPLWACQCRTICERREQRIGHHLTDRRCHIVDRQSQAMMAPGSWLYRTGRV